MDDKTIYDWGQSPPMAPSIKRVDPLNWIVASVVLGVAAAVVALLLAWRPIPGLSMPPGPLSEHASYWLKMTAHAVARSLFAEEARFYRGFFMGLPADQRNGLIWRVAFAAWAFLMPAVFLAKSSLRARDGLIHLRGSSRHHGPAAAKHLVAALRSRFERRPDHEIAPGIGYPADMFTRHVLVVAGVGAGKSTALKGLIDKIVASGEQMLLFDPKSEFTIGFAKPALMAPWDQRSLSWDIARDMRNLLDMRRFAATMIRESQDPMWSNASRQLLVGLMIYLRSTRGTDWGWLELRELIAVPQAQLLSIMKQWHPEAVRAVEKASVTTAGILINLSSFCSAIFDLAEAWGDVPAERRISFVEWTQGRSKFPQIILQGHGAYAELTKSYVEGIVGIVSAIVNSVEMEDDPSRKIWFIADEFAQMGKIPVRPLFEVGRSRGVRCVVACQDFAQLEEIYGAPMVKALIGMCGTLLVGQIMQGETAEQLCKAFGSREVERANMSASYGGAGSGPNRSSTLSFNRDEVALYKPSELSSRLGLTEDGKGVVLILFTGGQAYELFWPHYQLRRERVAHVPAPWTLGPVGVAASADAAHAHHAHDASTAPDESAHELPIRAETEAVGAVEVVEAGQVQEGSATMFLELSGREGEGTGPTTRPTLTVAVPDSVLSAPLEVRAAHAQPERGEAEGEPSPLAEAVIEAALHGAGLDTVSSASVALSVADAVFDSRSGPREEVILRQATPTPPVAQEHQSVTGDQGNRKARSPRRIFPS